MDLNDSELNSSQDAENGNEKSLVGKLRKNVSEFISTPLSKWFKKQNDSTPVSTIRRRQEDSDEEEDLQELQPPSKRTKLPPTKESLSLNVSEFLSPISSGNNVKKPLYRNFPEPVAGPSGYQTRQMLNSTALRADNNFEEHLPHSNQRNSTTVGPIESTHKDQNSDSEESTSGYSSGRLGSREIVSQESSKQTSPTDNRQKTRSLFQSTSISQLFSNKTSESHKNSNLTSRMPSFNYTAFGSTSFEDRTLTSKRILSSPFYNGPTTYGGASAYKRSRIVPQKTHRKSVNIKPVNLVEKKPDQHLGNTARKILDVLEQYSSPVSDAKKVPVTSKKHKSEGSLSRYIGANPYLVKETRNASTRELQVPSVSSLIRGKNKLQESTEAARQVAMQSKPISEYQIPVHKENEKHTNKMKTKISSVRQRLHVDDYVTEVRLNPVSLPIKDLPKFDTPIFAPPVSTAQKVPEVATKHSEPVEKPQNSPNLEFKFAAPLVLAEYLKPIKALNNFKFSEPLVKKRRSIHDQDKDDGPKPKKYNGNMSQLSKSEPMWECSACWIKNQGDQVKCIACQTAKSKPKLVSEPVFPLVPKMPAADTWECPTCMIRNKQDLLKCAACEEKKPGSETKSSTVKVPETISQPMGTFSWPAGQSGTKAAETTWECPICMIRNKPEVQKCVACEAPNPKSQPATTAQPAAPIQPVVPVQPAVTSNFGSQFKKKSDEWECGVCMIRNKASDSKCPCCETPNPSAKSSGTSDGKEKSPPKFNFGIDKAATGNFTFGIPPQQQDSTAPKTNASLIFGENRKQPDDTSAKTPSFSFGVPQNKEDTPKDLQNEKPEEPKSSSTFSFGTPTKTSEKTTEKMFGAAEEKKAEIVQKTPETKTSDAAQKTTPLFTFSSTSKSEAKVEPTKTVSTPTLSFGATKKTSEKEEQIANKPTFSFGETNKSNNVTETSKNPAPTFSFGSPKTAEKENKPSFGFGKTESSDINNKVSTSSGFSFGAVGDKTDLKAVGGEAKVNPLLKPGEKLPEKAVVAPIGFSFGLPKASEVVSSAPEVSSTDGTPNKRTKPLESEAAPLAKVPSFGFKSPVTRNGDVTKSEPTQGGFKFTFGSNAGPTFASAVSQQQADSSKPVAPMFKSTGISFSPPKPSNGFSFDAPNAAAFGAKPTATVAKPFTFGAPDSTTQQSTFPNQTAPSFSFGSNVPENKPFGSENKSQFSFAAAAAAPKAAAPSFNFNQTTTPAFSFGSNSPQTKPVTFGAASTTPVVPNMFGSSKPVESTGFGATPAAQNGSFNFGATPAASQKAGFSFGAASAPGDKPSGGFNFGAAAAASVAPQPTGSSGGFNFSASAPSFDPKPNFNFTGGAGLTSFSAAPSTDGSAMPQRKIRKAVRRTVR
ncbi:nuclear pore complex protein Nup153 [Anthonomus grandis grandis]|uniref:nuclear pore complex protein Nup153 n=1 Tax=Anthonomus grandis grandis TaxID=2921223 RepID=UPI002166160D|nr:nuclear pore complex protein Nup153 [Anthonomus grandis grandis]